MSDHEKNDAAAHPPDSAGRDFVRTIIDADLAAGKNDGRVATRFPPEPNGYLHIGHAKAICLSFSIALEYGGTCNLRFDDTNPEKEDMEFVEAIQRDIRWLGFDWKDRLFFASDYYEKLYDCAVVLIKKGKAYVDSLSSEKIREYRGTINEPGRPSPYRDRSVEENLDLFERMRKGEFQDGEHVLRAKIDLSANNMLMRDPVLYRIRHAEHYRRGNEWCLYPLYDFTHCLSDSFEGITHSLCSLEFENNRELYDWVVEETEVPHVPHQYEFARLNLSYTVMSKRKLALLVREGHVAGWDDPRMPTLSGLRRRGYTPEAIRNFSDRVGVAKSYNVIDVAFLEWAIRDDLNMKVKRVLAVLDPLEVEIENYPEGEVEQLEAPYYPHDVPLEGSRQLPFAKRILIERDDFSEDPPPGYYRLAPGREVRLRYGYFIRLKKIIKDDSGEIQKLICTYDPETRGGQAPDGRKVDGTIHWVAAEHSLPAEVRVYDRLFLHEDPDEGEDFRVHLNPDSLRVASQSRVEPSVAGAEPGASFQFERQGYFVVDPDSSADGLVFNRTVTLRDTWAKLEQADDAVERQRRAAERAAEKAAYKAKQKELSRTEAVSPALSAEEEAAAAGYRELGVAEQDARLLAQSADLAGLFGPAREAHDAPAAVAAFLVNEVQRELKGREFKGSSAADLPFGGAEIGELTALVDAGKITGTAAKDVFAEMLAGGGRPAEIVAKKGLEKLDGEDALGPIVERVLGREADNVAAYRAGKTALMGFFVGQVMKETRGRANPQSVRDLLEKGLAG